MGSIKLRKINYIAVTGTAKIKNYEEDTPSNKVAKAIKEGKIPWTARRATTKEGASA